MRSHHIEDEPSLVVEVCAEPDRQLVSVEAFNQCQPTVIRITLGPATAFIQDNLIINAVINSMDQIKTIILPKNIPTPLVSILQPMMNIEGATYHYLEPGETALGKGLYSMQMGFLPSEMPSGSTSTISDGFKPFPEIKHPGTWGGDDGFKPIPGTVDDITDGYHDHPDIPVEKREMWVEDPARMNRLSYMPLAYARGEDRMPDELGGGAIRQ